MGEEAWRMRSYLLCLLALLTLAFSCLPARAVLAEDPDVIIYDAADFTNLRGRSQQDVMEKYTEAQTAGLMYMEGNSGSYYDVPASTSAPYAAGVLSSDTLLAMKGMSNFYRWLIGVEDLAVNTTSNASLQAQALDRNFQFAHYISNDSKPADMDADLWAEGFNCTHNILADGYSPARAVTGWLNEGYDLRTASFGTTGHRTAILNAGYRNIIYGYSGRVAIGTCGASGNAFSNAFAAFPAAGYMPAGLVSKSEASWSVQLNTGIVKANNTANVVITVENLTTGASYTCTKANGKAQVSAGFLNFVQPSDASGSYYTDSYKVTAAGLYDVTTGKAASITYTVRFFPLQEIRSAEISQGSYVYTGEEIRPAVTVKGSGNTVLTEGTDYTVAYYNNVEEGTAVAVVSGMGNYCGVKKKTFMIAVDRKDMSQSIISLPSSSYSYNGKAITPAVTVESFGTVLTEGTDYEVEYRNNIYPGTAEVEIRGIGGYTGQVLKSFRITKGYQSITRSITSSQIELGGTAVITAAALDGAEITFSSSDEAVAVVDPDGTVHGLSAGSAKITITAAATDYYYSTSVSLNVSVSEEFHTMVETDVTYADGSDNTATVHRVCSVCGKEETVSFTTMSSFSVWYWTGYNGSSGISSAQSEGDEHRITLRSSSPSDAEDKTLVLASSDTGVMTVNGLSFRFVGAGNVTLTIYAKYRPSLKITKNFTVSHVYDEGTVVKIPTCAEPGQKEVTCSVCGQTAAVEIPVDPENHTGETYLKNNMPAACVTDGYTGDICCQGCDAVLEQGSVIPAAGHTEEPLAAVEATCTETGLTEGVKCSVCSEILVEQEVIPAKGHTPEVIPGRAATCMEEGISDGSRCSVCSEILAAQEVIPAKGHTPETIPGVEASCTETGLTEGSKCSVCEAILTAQEVIPAKGHTPEVLPGKEATCTETGLTEGSKCSVCEAILTAQEVIPAKGHTPEALPAAEASCTETGLTEGSKCSVCSEILTAQEVIPAKGHRPESIPGTEASCTETGLTEGSKCSVCSEILTAQEVIPAKGHTPEIIPGRAATCTEEGISDGSRCSVCEVILTAQEVIPAKGHTPESIPGTEATCTETGLTEGSRCSVCEAILTAQEVIPAKGHTPETIPERAASCTETGLTEGSRCSVCEVILTAQEVIPAKGHTPEIMPARDASCTETGLTEGSRCSTCGEILTAQEVIPAKGHTPETIPGTAASCTEAGLTEGSKCTVCGEILTAQEVIPAKGHTPVVIPGRAATCTEDGISDGSRCSVCEVILTEQEVIPAGGHKPETIPGREASCTENGLTEGSKCSVCEVILTEQEVIPAKGHTPETMPARDATCTETGLTEGSRCSACSEILVAQEVIPASGHDWDEGRVTKEATYEEDGVKTYTCRKNGSHTREEAIPKLEKTEAQLKEEADTAAAEAAGAVLTALKTADSITLEDEAAVEEAREAYENLTEDQKKKVPAEVLKKLTDSEEKIRSLKQQAAEEEAARKAAEKAEAEAKAKEAAEKAEAEAKAKEAAEKAEAEAKAKEAAEKAEAEAKAKEAAEKAEAEAKAKEAAEKAEAEAKAKEEAGKAEAAARKAEAAAGRMAGIPAAAELTLENAAAIEEAAAAYEVLTAEEKALVPAETVRKLEEAQAQLTVLKAEAADDVSLKNVEKSITSQKNDNDPKGSAFAPLKAKAVSVTRTSLKLGWTKVRNAKGYTIYGNACGKKNKMVKIASTTRNKITVKKVKGKALKPGKYYKFVVVAYGTSGGYEKTLATSKTIHACTAGGKVTNPKKVTVKASKVTVKKGKKYTIKARQVSADSRLKVKKHRALKYESSSTKIATVTNKGVVKAKKKGKAIIYVYAQNGVCATVKVTVK